MRYINILAGSTPTILVSVSAAIRGDTYDPSDSDVECAFVTKDASPTGDAWLDATWKRISRQWWAKVLCPALSAGTYDIYVRLTDLPDIDAQQSITRLVVH